MYPLVYTCVYPLVYTCVYPPSLHLSVSPSIHSSVSPIIHLNEVWFTGAKRKGDQWSKHCAKNIDVAQILFRRRSYLGGREQPFSWQKYFPNRNILASRNILANRNILTARDIVNFSTVRSCAEKCWCRQSHGLKFWTGQNISRTSFNRREIPIKYTQLDSWVMLSRGSVWLINH